MMGNTGKVFLIDFDRGEIKPAGKWQQQNLERLKRSFEKFKSKDNRFQFDETLWEGLMQGYNSL
jgi:3-deoxy-D-manno-octulosonic acid kinase